MWLYTDTEPAIISSGTGRIRGQPDAALDGVSKSAQADGHPVFKLSENVSEIALPDKTPQSVKGWLIYWGEMTEKKQEAIGKGLFLDLSSEREKRKKASDFGIKAYPNRYRDRH